MTPDGTPVIPDEEMEPAPNREPVPEERVTVQSEPERGWAALYGRWCGRLPAWARESK